MSPDKIKQFWDQHSQCFTKIIQSPIYQQFLVETVKAVAIRNGDRVLDLGCGPGYLSRALWEAGARVTAVDYSNAMLEEARAFLRQGRIQGGEPVALVNQDAHEYLAGTSSGAFDVVLASLFLAYVKEPQAALAQMSRVLKPGGRLVMSNPMPNFPFSRAARRSVWTALRHPHKFFQIIRYFQKLKRLERGGVFRFFSSDETRQMLIQAGFQEGVIVMHPTLSNTAYLTVARKADSLTTASAGDYLVAQPQPEKVFFRFLGRGGAPNDTVETS